MTLAVCVQTLPVGAIVRDWRVDAVVSVSEEAVLYAACHAATGEGALLQEYFPPSLGLRHPDGTVSARGGEAAKDFDAGRETFLMQGAALAGLAASRPSPHLPCVRTVFAHAGTAYMVLERQGGVPLSSELELGHRQSEERLLALFRPMVLALGQLHEAGICHLRIHPDVILRQQRRLVLAGFAGGFATRTWEEDRNTVYSPIELLVPVAEPGPWSDIYSLGAVLYHCVTGAPPPEAITRVGDVQIPPSCAGDYSPAFLEAIVSALACIPAERPQSIRQWCEAWPHAPAPEPTPEPTAEAEAGPRKAGPPVPVDRPAREEPARASLVPVEDGAAAKPRRFGADGLIGQMALPCLGGVVMAGGILLALSHAREFLPERAEATHMEMMAGGLPPPQAPSAPQQLSAPLLLLEHELATARDTAKHIDAQIKEAEALDWPAERVTALRQAAGQASKAVAEMEALYAAPDLARRKPTSASFLTVLEEQSRAVRTALKDAWRISVAGYAEAGEKLFTNGNANFQLLEKLLANDDRAEPALLRGTAATAHELMQAAYRRLSLAARAEETPANAMAAGRKLAEMSAAFGEVQSQATAIREALRAGRQQAAQRAEELDARARERKTFDAALLAAHRTASALERAIGAARESGKQGPTSEWRAYASARLKEATRRLAGLERIVADTPDIRGPRLQTALTEVRETEKALRALLQEARQPAVASAETAPDPAVARLLRRADSRLARDYRRFAELRDMLAGQGGIVRIRGGDPAGGQDLGGLQRDLKALAAIRDRLAAARTEADAQDLYKQFSAQHERVDGQLDRMLNAAAKAARLSREAALR